VNGTDKSTAETNSSGEYSFAGISGISANDSVIVYLDGETEDGSTVTLAVNGSTAIATLDIVTGHISLESRTASAITNADLDDIDGVDVGDEDGIAITINGADENATYVSGMELYIVGGDSYAPGGTVTTQGAGGDFHIDDSSAANFGTYTATISGNVNIDASAAFTSTSGTLSVAGNWTNAGTFTHNSGMVTFNGSAAQTITTGGTGAGKDFNNVTFSNSYGTPPNITYATNALTIGGM